MRIQARLACVLLALTCHSVAQAQTTTMRRIPDDNLSYPVLIKLNGADTGSGFYLNSGKNLFLVTAKHVLLQQDGKTFLAPQAEVVAYARDRKDPRPGRLEMDLELLKSHGDLRSHALHDVVLVRIGTVGGGPATQAVSPMRGVTVTNPPASGFVSVGLDLVKRFDDVLVSNEVIIFGYPSSIGVWNVPQIDYTRPLLRKGIIAGTNSALKSIVLDCPVYAGNSGGPVLELAQENIATTRLHVIGVVIEYVPIVQRASPGSQTVVVENSGYAIAAAMDSVLELISSIERPTGK